MTDASSSEPIDRTHDPGRVSWVRGSDHHPDFPVQNLPFGIFAADGGTPRAGAAIGEMIFDMRAAAQHALLPAECAPALGQPTLNALFAMPASSRLALRHALSDLLSDAAQAQRMTPLLHEAEHCRLFVPVAIGDFTDFYAGIHHARTVGGLYRPDDPLTPNYKHLPVGYNARTSSIRTSGEAVVRPHGQTLEPGASKPKFGPSCALDYELELGLLIGAGNTLGEPIPIASVRRHIAGLCLLNDWSARDLQAWERLPLGPFLGKSFHTSLSPWVVTTQALAPFRIAPTPRPADDPEPLPYLRDPQDNLQGQWSIDLQASLTTPALRAAGLPPAVLSSSRAADMYWTFAQLVTHLSSNGCNLQPGDLVGSGTISGPAQNDSGSLFEISRGGTKKLALPTGETRSYLMDGDEVILQARATAPGRVPIGFGMCRATVHPARS